MNNELDREALLIYLNDLRTMETIVHEDDKKLKSLEEKTNTYEKQFDTVNSEMRTQLRNKPSATPEIKSEEDAKSGSLGLWIFVEVVSVGIFGLIIGFEEDLIGYLVLLGIIAGILWGVHISYQNKSTIESIRYSNSKARRECKERLDKFEEQYSIKKKEVSQALRTLNTFKDDTENCITEMNNEKEEMEQKLQEAYSANIIPLQFRNIEGIYYLYDYISTSNQGLSEALMQCNLEAIKQQINQVVNLQGEMIVRQAQHNAAMYEQNQQLLNMAQATMVNTALAAKYARISAVNSEVALRLQSKDLAYQKADFWLK